MNWIDQLLGKAPSPASSSDGAAAPGEGDPPEAWALAAARAADHRLALVCLARVEDEALLEQIAIQGRFAEVRLAAARRIDGGAALERVARAAKGLDKAVFRHCADALRARRERLSGAAHAVRLAAALREFMAAPPLSVSRLIEYEKELAAALARGGHADGSDEVFAECRALCAQATAQLREEGERARRERARRRAPDGDGVPPQQDTAVTAQESAAPAPEAGAPVVAEADPEAAPRARRAAGAPKRPGRSVDRGTVRALLLELEDALERGHLADAEAVARRLKSATGGATVERHDEARLARAQARLGELRDWARWSAGMQRSQLIEAAQALCEAKVDVEHAAAAVPALREAWNRLGAQAPAQREQWRAFDAALEAAYRPVAARRAQEAAQREGAERLKKALCEEFEAWAASVDEAQPDFGLVERRAAEFRTAWRAAPNAGYRAERQLRKRADALQAGLEARLAEARAAETARREQLVAAAQALAADADLRRALSGAKELQERWRAGPGAPHLERRAEQQLWRRFRGACDAVFARRDAQRREQADRLSEQEQQRAQLLAELAAALQETDGERMQRALARFRAAWQAARPAPPAALQRQAAELEKRARLRLAELRQVARRARLDELRRRAPSLEGLDDESLERGRLQREDLLVDLEIALDLPSPTESAPARRRRQIERLQMRFRGGPPQRADAEGLLARCFEIAAGADAGHERRLASIIDRLVQQGGS